MIHLEKTFALNDLKQQIIEAKKKELKSFNELKSGTVFVLFGDKEEVPYLKVEPTSFNPSNVINLLTGEWDIYSDIFVVYELPPLINLIIPDVYIRGYGHDETLSYKYDLTKIIVYVIIGKEQCQTYLPIADRITDARYRDILDVIQAKLQKDIKSHLSIITIDDDVLEAPFHINMNSIAGISIRPAIADDQTWKNNLNYILKGGVPLFL